jgi:hypothetical protein
MFSLPGAKLPRTAGVMGDFAQNSPGVEHFCMGGMQTA